MIFTRVGIQSDGWVMSLSFWRPYTDLWEGNMGDNALPGDQLNSSSMLSVSVVGSVLYIANRKFAITVYQTPAFCFYTWNVLFEICGKKSTFLSRSVVTRSLKDGSRKCWCQRVIIHSYLQLPNTWQFKTTARYLLMHCSFYPVPHSLKAVVSQHLTVPHRLNNRYLMHPSYSYPVPFSLKATARYIIHPSL